MMLVACNGPNNDTPENANTKESPAVTDTDATLRQKKLQLDDAASSMEAQADFSSVDFFRIEWVSGAEDVCRGVLSSLNTSRSEAWDAEPKSVALDYASVQAGRYLDTKDNVKWRRKSFSALSVDDAEVAEFEYFNDNIIRTIVRAQTAIGGNRLISLAVFDSASSKLIPLSFGHAGVSSKGLPDTVNLHTKLTYSVADIIQLNEDYYTLLMPLSDFDASGRVYLAAWRAKAGTVKPRQAMDYYPELACVFRPENSPSALAQ